MARTSIKKNVVKEVNYLNKDFSDFRDNLIEFAKQYFPNTYNDVDVYTYEQLKISHIMSSKWF